MEFGVIDLASGVVGWKRSVGCVENWAGLGFGIPYGRLAASGDGSRLAFASYWTTPSGAGTSEFFLVDASGQLLRNDRVEVSGGVATIRFIDDDRYVLADHHARPSLYVAR